MIVDKSYVSFMRNDSIMSIGTVVPSGVVFRGMRVGLIKAVSNRYRTCHDLAVVVDSRKRVMAGTVWSPSLFGWISTDPLQHSSTSGYTTQTALNGSPFKHNRAEQVKKYFTSREL